VPGTISSKVGMRRGALITEDEEAKIKAALKKNPMRRPLRAQAGGMELCDGVARRAVCRHRFEGREGREGSAGLLATVAGTAGRSD
jgi:hypothetical protein